jgi:cystathionine gamma-synthase
MLFYKPNNSVKLADICAQKFGAQGDRCILLPSQKAGESCRSFIADRSSKLGTPVNARLIQLHVSAEKGVSPGILVDPQPSDVTGPTVPFSDLFIILVAAESFSLAKEFWQHTGMGISSRLADHFLSLLPAEGQRNQTPPTNKVIGKVANRHYSAKPKRQSLSPPASPVTPQVIEDLTVDHSTYLEERYGRNLPLKAAPEAKRALRRRIAGVIRQDPSPDCPDGDCAGNEDLIVGPSSRGVPDVTENDVFLYPGGMNAIWNAHQLLLSTRPPAKAVCFGFAFSFPIRNLHTHFVADFPTQTL